MVLHLIRQVSTISRNSHNYHGYQYFLTSLTQTFSESIIQFIKSYRSLSLKVALSNIVHIGRRIIPGEIPHISVLRGGAAGRSLPRAAVAAAVISAGAGAPAVVRPEADPHQDAGERQV